MAQQEIVIEVGPDGVWTVEGKGIDGPVCEALTLDLEENLGAVLRRTLKPEYRKPVAVQKGSVKRG